MSSGTTGTSCRGRDSNPGSCLKGPVLPIGRSRWTPARASHRSRPASAMDRDWHPGRTVLARFDRSRADPGTRTPAAGHGPLYPCALSASAGADRVRVSGHPRLTEQTARCLGRGSSPDPARLSGLSRHLPSVLGVLVSRGMHRAGPVPGPLMHARLFPDVPHRGFEPRNRTRAPGSISPALRGECPSFRAVMDPVTTPNPPCSCPHSILL